MRAKGDSLGGGLGSGGGSGVVRTGAGFFVGAVRATGDSIGAAGELSWVAVVGSRAVVGAKAEAVTLHTDGLEIGSLRGSL